MGTVLITGCSSGIGEATALAFARAGWRTIATMRSADKGAALREAAAAESLDLTVVALDVNDEASVVAALAEAGHVDVLINNAGIELLGPTHLASDEEARWQFETNVFGLLRMVRHVAPVMVERGSGTIVNVGSTASFISVPYAGLYAASKHAVSAISEALQFELGAHGVKVLMIEPGRFGTELTANARIVDALDGSRFTAGYDSFKAGQAKTSSADSHAPPSDAAAEILAAVMNPDSPLHVQVGVDAVRMRGLANAMTFEQYESVLRQALDWTP
jgi:NADP-dependent 3-hydroxy acid dehydrogenase YdfG